MTTAAGTSVTETPFYFEAGEHILLGILTAPVGAPADTAVVLATGGWHGTSADRNRWFVGLARSLATDLGIASLRFDYHGVGESSGRPARFRLSSPYAEDVSAAIELLRSEGYRRIMAVGHCFGGRSILAAERHQSRLDGAVLISVPLIAEASGTRRIATDLENVSLLQIARRSLRPAVVRSLRDAHFRRAIVKTGRALLPRLLRRNPATASVDLDAQLLAQIHAMTAEQAPLLMLYGRNDVAAREALTRLSLASSHLRLHVVASETLDFSRLSLQEQLASVVLDWCQQFTAARG